MYSNMFSNMYCVIRLTHFSPVSHFYTPWKRQKTKVFLTFSRGIEMWHWTKMAYGHSLLVWENVGFPNLVWLLLLACLFVFLWIWPFLYCPSLFLLPLLRWISAYFSFLPQPLTVHRAAEKGIIHLVRMLNFPKY